MLHAELIIEYNNTEKRFRESMWATWSSTYYGPPLEILWDHSHMLHLFINSISILHALNFKSFHTRGFNYDGSQNQQSQLQRLKWEKWKHAYFDMKENKTERDSYLKEFIPLSLSLSYLQELSWSVIRMSSCSVAWDVCYHRRHLDDGGMFKELTLLLIQLEGMIRSGGSILCSKYEWIRREEGETEGREPTWKQRENIDPPTSHTSLPNETLLFFVFMTGTCSNPLQLIIGKTPNTKHHPLALCIW